MRTTLDLPEQLVKEAMRLTHISSKTELIRTALQKLIQQQRAQELKQYFGKLDLEIDLDALRRPTCNTA